MSAIIPFREVLPFIRFEDKLSQRIFVEAFDAMLTDLELADYIPRSTTQEKISMLQTLVEDRRFAVEEEEDELEAVLPPDDDEIEELEFEDDDDFDGDDDDDDDEFDDFDDEEED